MLIRMNSSTSGDLIMFSEPARRLFDVIGKECTARGVFTNDQLPEAIDRLKAAISEEKRVLHDAEQKKREEALDLDEDEQTNSNDSSGANVHLGQRATPLVRLMEWTLKEKGFILWEAEHDF